MKIKEIMRKTAMLGLALSMAFTTAAVVPTQSGIVSAAEQSISQKASESSPVYLDSPSDVIASYNGGSVSNSYPFYIVISDTSVDVNASNIGNFTTSNSGIYYAKEILPNDIGNIYLSNTTITRTGTYRVSYYGNMTVSATAADVYSFLFKVESSRSSSSSSNTTSSGPQISNRKFTIYGYGIDATFRVTNESCDYTWYIYDKTPSNKSKTEIDSGSGSTSAKNEDIYITSDKLDKNTTYYFYMEVTGDNTRRTNYYTDGGSSTSSNSYYSFKTKNTDTYPTGTSSSGTNTTKTKDKSGNTVEKKTTKSGTITTVTETTTYTAANGGGSKTVITQTDSSTGSQSVRTTTVNSSGAGTDITKVTAKDKSYTLSEGTIASSGAKSYVNSAYSTAGTITALSTMNVAASGAETISVTYGITDAEDATISVKKINNTKKATVKVPDSIVANNEEYTVTSVAANAFKGNSKVKKLVLGDGITKVGKNAFKGNKNLKTIVINSPLSSVGTNAFKGIKSGATIKISAGTSSYKKTVKRIQKAGVTSKVKFVNI